MLVAAAAVCLPQADAISIVKHTAKKWNGGFHDTTHIIQAEDVIANDGSDVETLTPDNFEDTMNNCGHCMVFMYSPVCGHCKHDSPDYVKAADALKDEGIALYRFNALENEQFGNAHGLDVYPTVLEFTDGEYKKYHGDITYDALLHHFGVDP